MEKEINSNRETLNNISTHTNSDNSSVYTHHFTPFNTSLRFLKKIRLSDMINKKIEKEKDENIYLFKVEYVPQESNQSIEWEIYKSFHKIKNLIISVRELLKFYLVDAIFTFGKFLTERG